MSSYIRTIPLLQKAVSTIASHQPRHSQNSQHAPNIATQIEPTSYLAAPVEIPLIGTVTSINTSIVSTDDATSASSTAAQRRSVSEQIATVIRKRIKNKNASPANFQAVKSLMGDLTIYRGTSRTIFAEYLNLVDFTIDS
ncbi:hypothetical protein CUC08_Gglean005789 [Alternaria sp. MG1]|nr:hypothetical protein CUC08_Gglean005789 [Alternaria sp. MG1]